MIDISNFTETVRDILGEEYDAFLASYDLSPAKGIRLNPQKKPSTSLSHLCDGKIPYSSNGFYTLASEVGNDPYHRAGCYYSQEPSAMFPAETLSPQEGERVLDLCAAPGGKSGQIAEKIGKGVLVSNEINGDRCKILLSNVERLGYTNVVVTCLSPKDIAKELRGWFDKVLVDAPCSGEGMFRKNPEAYDEWSYASVLSCAERQLEILNYGGECVRKGGKLVYSTCTFSKEENEDVVEKFLQNGDFILLNVEKNNGVSRGLDERGFTARLYPHKLRGEGHFTALFERVTPNESVKERDPLKSLSPKEKKLIDDFSKKHLNVKREVMKYNDNVIIPPAIRPPITKGVLCYGVKFGDIDERVIPHHQFYSAYGKDFKVKADLDINDDRLYKYLRGEEIDFDGDNGWCSVLLDGVPLGGGKITDGKLKNKYPKGLRK